MKALLLKLDTATYTRWKADAERLHVGVSEWIRHQCNTSLEGERSVRPVPVIQSVGINLSQPESAGENGSAIHSKREDVDVATVAVGVNPAAVTRENFAELAAGIAKDELDMWARSLQREVLPSHSATSHRHTCLCTFCLEWRKANYIPYGGPVKKEKAKRE
jgi:hypothetical protein